MQNLRLVNAFQRISRTERVDIRFKRIAKSPENENQREGGPATYSLFAYSPDHFITKNVNLTSNITGYNDVTPKAGAERLVITSTNGKPVLTTWRFGLGRVAALTTDNGGGESTRWA